MVCSAACAAHYNIAYGCTHILTNIINKNVNETAIGKNQQNAGLKELIFWLH